MKAFRKVGKTRRILTGLCMLCFLGTACAKDNGSKSKAPAVDGYTLVFEDEFNGKSLNLKDWNIEYHEPGWVNNELQEYGDSKENIYVKDGKLVIQPLSKRTKVGTLAYTSGRINTQNKHTIKYGKVEVCAKVPAGKGFLPAAWMMPNDENLYGQWPKCGEIDIMEVLGDKTATLYSTLHFGEPHAESQGTYLLKGGNFAKEFHVFGMEWEPGEIRFYVDGILFHTENDWYSKKDGFGEVTYPAPYDQPFYLILNVAVGGNWPGNPDITTKFDQNAAMYVDYVRLYQKNEYDENVEKPVKKVTFREADASGNYILDGKFSDENFAAAKNWQFLTAGTGKASASVSKNTMNIATEKAGDLDYSVQLVQANVPMEKGSKYRWSFDISADEDRTVIAAITAPEVGWIRYLDDTKINIGPKKKTVTFDVEMTKASDSKARIEWNMGNQGSTAGVHISNVRFEKLGSFTVADDASCLPDGNYVYNGKFQEGKGRMDFWKTEGKSGVAFEVTNKDNIRELKVKADGSVKSADAKLIQEKLALNPNKEYKLSFTAHADSAKNIKVQLAGQEFDAAVGTETKEYTYVFKTGAKVGNSDLVFLLGNAGETFIDDVRVAENALIINGDFAGGMTGYEVYAYTASDVSYVVDTMNEDSAFCIDVNNTGDLDWKIQLKQNGILLEKGAKYRFSFDAKCTQDRKIMHALQRDGSADDNWIPYSGSNIIKLTQDFQKFSIEFEMKNDTDPATILSISMGAVDGKKINTKHTVVIDNIVLEKLK